MMYRQEFVDHIARAQEHAPLGVEQMVLIRVVTSQGGTQYFTPQRVILDKSARTDRSAIIVEASPV